MNRKIILILASLIFAIMLCGSATAATQANNTTTDNNTTVCAADPIINGTVTISEYGKVRPLKGAKITINSTSNRILATATTDENGYYTTCFYSTETTFKVTAEYIGCPTITQNVNVAQINGSDPNYYATANFQMIPRNATLTSTGSGSNVYVAKAGAYEFAGIIRVSVNGATYNAFCIDLYTPIAIGDVLLVNGPLPGTSNNNFSSLIDWGKVNYIVTHYTPSTNTEAAAMQCAIWYFTSVQYGAYPGNDSSHPGYYQFMTNPSDGLLSGGSTAVRNRALQIINDAISVQYPYNVSIDPEMVRLPNGQAVNIVATVTDIYGNPLSGVTVNFTRTAGTLNATSAVTDADGKVYVGLTSPGSNRSIVVTASVSGTYATLLYDDIDNPKQNLIAVNVLPYTLSAYSILNYDTTANVTLSQNVSKTVANVGETITYVVKASNIGSISATGLMIQDIVPAGLSNVVVTPSLGSYYNGMWVIPTLASGNNATLTITGMVTSSLAGLNTTNTATRICQDQYNAESNSTSSTFYTKKADVALSQTVNKTTVNVGETVTYTVTATNNGPDGATNIIINDVVPAGLRNVIVTPSTGTSYSNGVWTIHTLNNGASASLTITGIVTVSMVGLNTTNSAVRTSQDEYNSQSNVNNVSVYTAGRDNVYVSPDGDDITGDGTSSNPFKTLGAGILCVNSGGIIHMASGNYNEYNLTINKNMAIVGQNAISTVINAQELGRIFNITSGSTVSIHNLTLINGLVSGNGGAIYNEGNLTVMGCNLINNAALVSGGTVYNSGNVEIHFNRIIGSGIVISSLSGTVNATNNWWGSNVNPNNKVSGNVNVTTWLILKLSSSPNKIQTGNNSLIMVDLTHDQNGVYYNPDYGHIPDGLNIQFNSDYMGDITPEYVFLINGSATSIFKGLIPGNSIINGTLDNQIINTSIVIGTVNIGLRNYNVLGKYTNRYMGHTYPWVMDVYNNGPDDATGVIAEYVIGEGYEFLTCSPRGVGTATYNATTRTITWYIGHMPGVSTVYLDVVLRNIATGTLYTTARLTNVDQINLNNVTQNIRDMEVSVSADVEVNQTVSNLNPNVGEDTVVSIVVRNNGPNDATNVKIRYDLPVQLTYKGYSASKGTFYNTGLGYWIWNIGSLDNAESVTLDIYTTVNQSGVFNSTARRNGTGQSSWSQFDWIVNNNAKSIMIETLGQPSYSSTYNIRLRNYNVLGKYSNRNVKHTYPWLVDVSNLGYDVSNVIIEYVIGEGYEFLTCSPRGVGTADYNATTRTITWYIGYMPSGGTAYLDVALRVLESGSLDTTARVLETGQTNSTSMDVSKSADVEVNQTVSNLNPNVGEDTVVSIVVRNNGPNDATNVKIRYDLPVQLTYKGYSASKGTFYNTGLGYWIWNIGSLDNAESVKLDIYTTVNQSGVFNSTARRNGTGQSSWSQFDWNINNNFQKIDLNAQTADIQVNMMVDNLTPSTNEFVTYTILITNNGPKKATNVQITDILPSGLTFVSATGLYDQVNGTWGIDKIKKNETVTLLLTTRVTGSGSIINTATKTSLSEFDPYIENDVSTVTINII